MDPYGSEDEEMEEEGEHEMIDDYDEEGNM